MHVLFSESTVPSQPPTPKRRRPPAQSDSTFDPDTDYVSKLKNFLDARHRPHSGGPALAEYRLCEASPFQMDFQMEVRVKDAAVWHRGSPCRQKKLAKQSASYAALVHLGGLRAISF
eukprot:TRINITY_DN28498_c0_g1_i2.p1 TRINITY_DN28498_c0_g1~~TRINITY_DN28498_c0_g1_i2.p1  ORF type:complete len:117 (+),score=17.47 TRINITY_DN28498_c0_g1_i2:141-491(+)